MRVHRKSSFLELFGTAMQVLRMAPPRREPVAQPLFDDPSHPPAGDGFQPEVDWNDYQFFELAPAVFCYDAAAWCEAIAEDERSELARYMSQQFELRLRQRYIQVDETRQGTLRLEMTLTSIQLMEPPTARPGIPGASVRYTLRIYDASSRRLLRIYTDEQPPKAEDGWLTSDRLFSAKSGIRWAARRLMAKLMPPDVGEMRAL